MRQAQLAFPGISTLPCSLCLLSPAAKRPACWEGSSHCSRLIHGLFLQAPGANDKILIYTPAGNCVDYFTIEPENVLDQGLRTVSISPSEQAALSLLPVAGTIHVTYRGAA